MVSISMFFKSIIVPIVFHYSLLCFSNVKVCAIVDPVKISNCGHLYSRLKYQSTLWHQPDRFSYCMGRVLEVTSKKVLLFTSLKCYRAFVSHFFNVH